MDIYLSCVRWIVLYLFNYDEKYSLRNKRLENVVRFGEIQTVF